ncbi:LIM zinc-binding domain-containing protein [Meloidogyne graminicola]|uniref:LIM zinc-binding domain-containing protein n=1 Tax=Meloidogyne graminicola TaxID=189291 RepID=A0A8S9ZYQ2_9BILA|nr:LIM zinc-binding domain-containing protein [Meloidogyne graminicola]
MRNIKELSQWLDSCGLNQNPWASDPTDWATLLNLLTRLLHSTLEQRINDEENKKLKEKQKTNENVEDEEISEKEESESTSRQEEEEDKQKLLRSPSSTYPGTQLPFQEFIRPFALELAEKVLGVPQFTVIADMKKSKSEDRLALFISFCALKYAVENVDTQPIHDFQFTFRIYFNMDLDGSKRECIACGNYVHLIERVILIGRIWHRACLKCSLCGRQLYRGAFYLLHFSDASLRLECVEHGANALLFGDPKHRLALPPPPPIPSITTPSSRLSFIGTENNLTSSLLSLSSPPPRPPPPRLSSIEAVKKHKLNMEENKEVQDTYSIKEEEESIERKIALAAAAYHDAPIPKPRISLQKVVILEYPSELNPFGSDDDEEAEDNENQENKPLNNKELQTELIEDNFDKNKEERPISVINPFDDTEEEEEEEKKGEHEEMT